MQQKNNSSSTLDRDSIITFVHRYSSFGGWSNPYYSENGREVALNFSETFIAINERDKVGLYKKSNKRKVGTFTQNQVDEMFKVNIGKVYIEDEKASYENIRIKDFKKEHLKCIWKTGASIRWHFLKLLTGRNMEKYSLIDFNATQNKGVHDRFYEAIEDGLFFETPAEINEFFRVTDILIGH